MADILLAHSYFLAFDPKQQARMKPYPPLATLFAASYLREAGSSVALFDAMLSAGEHEFAEALARHQPQIVAIYEDNFNFLSKMCLSRMREAACAMVGMARAQGAFVLATGADATDHPDLYLRAGAHAVMVGEPDHTLREVVGYVAPPAPPVETQDVVSLPGGPGTSPPPATPRRAADLNHIPGLVLPAADGGTHSTPRRPVERYPDVFPQPAWDLVDVEGYRSAWTAVHGYFSLNMVSTRGCPFHCNWCAKPIWGQRYAMRSPASVADELAYLKRTYRPDHIWFADDIFGLRPQWVAEFGRAVAERDAAVPFMIQSRADLMTEQAVEGLRQAGCVEVWMGAESGSQRILDAMDKGVTVAEIHTARRRLADAGIRSCFFLQLGYPGELYEDILATIRLVRSAIPDNIGVSVSYPLPGTKFYDMVRDQLGDKTNWTDSGDLAMMFQGVYRSPLYRHLHTLLHHELDVYRAARDLRPRIDNDTLQSSLETLLTADSDPRPAVIILLESLDHQRNHTPDPQITTFRTALTQLAADWERFAELERRERSEAPTLLVKSYGRIAAPDLSREFN